MMWMALSSLTSRRKETERRGTLSFAAFSFCGLCFVLSFTFYLGVLSFRRHYRFVVLFYLPVCRFLASVSSFSYLRIVVLHLKQRREPRGALLFVLKGETFGEIHRRRFLSLSDLRDLNFFYFFYFAQVIRSSSRAPSCLTAKGIRERHGTLLFARRWSS